MTAYLSNDTITIRALEPTDLEILYKWENDTSLWEVGNTLTPYYRKQLWDYLESYDGDIYSTHQLRLMITLTETGENIGTLDFYEFDPFNNRAYIGILIDRNYQHRGYGTIAINLAIDYFKNYLGLCQLVATMPACNEHSIKLFQKCGFNSIGTMRAWLRTGRDYSDAILMQRVFI